MHRLSLVGMVGMVVTLAAMACDDAVEPQPPGPEAPEPILEALLVTGGRDLQPAFSPEITRYSLVAVDAAGDDLEFVPYFGADLTVAVDGVLVSSGGALTVSLEPDIEIEVAVANKDGDEMVYEIVYLPADFPELYVSVPRGEPAQGVTYLTIGEWLVIVDDHAVPLFYRRESGGVLDFKLHPSGERSYALRTGSRNEFDQLNNEIVVLGPDFEEVDRVTTVGLNQTDNHEFLIRDNGNYVLLSYHGEIRDLSSEGGEPDQVVVESVVQEITRGRDVVFQWTSWGTIPVSEALRDWADYAHVNSIFIDAAGDFILSARGVSQVLKVDGETAETGWKLGGMSNEFDFVHDPYSHLCGQHTARLLSDGNLLLFDNGQLCWPNDASRGDLTRVVEYELDEAKRTATLVWSYTQEDAYSRSQGSAQRLADGNTLIGWGNGPGLLATEVDPAGQKVWEIYGELEGERVLSYRAFRGPH